MKSSAKKPKTLVFRPGQLEGKLKCIGGSKSDVWNLMLVNQAATVLWTRGLDEETRDKYQAATVEAMAGIGPRDELEGMMAAQLIAAHNAAMECYRRAMIGEQTFEGRRENLAQANKLSRTYATLLEALNRHRGKGQQKVTVEHVHVHGGGRAIVGNVSHPGGGSATKNKDKSHAFECATGTEMPRQIEAEQQAMPVANRERE